MTLEILYQDEHLVAINKPAGLLVHRSWLDKGETQFAMQMTRDQIGQHVFTVHRLDRPTSGILLFALDSETARLMTEQFATHQIQKQYLAIVRGWLPLQTYLDYPLKEELDRIADKFANQDKDAQPAKTFFRCLERVELPFAVSARHPSSRYSLVRCLPLTGRKHQLRRHLAHLRHPIVGDTSHGDGKHNRFFREQFQCDRLMLHHDQMSFRHPHTQALVHIEAPLDEHWLRRFEAFQWPTLDTKKPA